MSLKSPLGMSLIVFKPHAGVIEVLFVIIVVKSELAKPSIIVLLFAYKTDISNLLEDEKSPLIVKLPTIPASILFVVNHAPGLFG